MMDRAVERMAALIRDGQRPAFAARIAAYEHNLDEHDVARECAKHGAEVQQRLRMEAGRMTQDEARAFLREHLSPREHVNRESRRCAAKVFYAVMTVSRADRDIVREWIEAADGLDQDAWLIAAFELYTLWSLLPESMDPRPLRSTPIPKSSFMWPYHERCAWYRWVSRG